ncbi:subunit of DNA-directed RNA polymerase, partial [Hamiltosporidium magnivora]
TPTTNNNTFIENNISGILSKIREKCGNICIKELNKKNSPLIMQACGSKGSKINVSQMIACVGQQIISGNRIPNGFYKRSLPHFTPMTLIPQSKGFVSSSFFTGLNPIEFFFHAVSGREGLVDTAVKTAETGYMQRRLMKALEDLSVQYDYSVRNSCNEVVQFVYGDDCIDPCLVEEESSVVDLEKVYREVKGEIIREYSMLGVKGDVLESSVLGVKGGVLESGVLEGGVLESSVLGVKGDVLESSVLESNGLYDNRLESNRLYDIRLYSNNNNIHNTNTNTNNIHNTNIITNTTILSKINTFLKGKEGDTIFIKGKHIKLVESNSDSKGNRLDRGSKGSKGRGRGDKGNDYKGDS